MGWITSPWRRTVRCRCRGSGYSGCARRGWSVRRRSGGRNVLNESWQECYEERAAILQFDAGMSRDAAEKAAQALVDAARIDKADAGGQNNMAVDAAIQSAAYPPPPNHGIPRDPAARRDPAAHPGAAENRAHRPADTPYAVAAARASPAYLASLKLLQQTLPNFKPASDQKGVVP